MSTPNTNSVPAPLLRPLGNERFVLTDPYRPNVTLLLTLDQIRLYLQHDADLRGGAALDTIPSPIGYEEFVVALNANAGNGIQLAFIPEDKAGVWITGRPPALTELVGLEATRCTLPAPHDPREAIGDEWLDPCRSKLMDEALWDYPEPIKKQWQWKENGVSERQAKRWRREDEEAMKPFVPSMAVTNAMAGSSNSSNPDPAPSNSSALSSTAATSTASTHKLSRAASGKTPTPLPSQSAWAKGPPQSNSSAAPSPRSQSPAPTHVASPIAISHSRRPSALGQGVSVKDGVSVPRNNVGSVVRPASVVFGSIDDASAPLSSSPAAIPAVKTEVVKSFGSVPATSSNHVNGKTSASASATGSSKQPSRPSLSSTPSNSSALSSAAATSSASTPKPSRADITKLFHDPLSSSSRPSSDTSSSDTSSSDTSSPSTWPSNLPPHHQPSSSSSQQPQQPSQLGTHSYSQFVPNSMRPPQQPAGTPRSPAFSRAVPGVRGGSRRVAGPGGPGGPPIPASPRMAPHPHQAPPGGIAPQVPMRPMSWGGYYYIDPYQPQPPWGYYAMPSQHMHQQPHPQHVPHVTPPHQPGPLPLSPRPADPQPPNTPTTTHTIPHPPHTPQPPPSISSPPPTPSTPP
ncbi:hypothetical protein F4604DRAFT_578674 [Suillus subluteus]|nr:hypothetical protein F4604DRAFT_578674 [Suillus subluteus]